MVGDPSGRSEERNLLDDDMLDHNVACIKEQLGRIVDLGDRRRPATSRGELVDNRDWTQPITILEFLRDVGKHVTVNQMLARESIKMRINSEHGISFTEFSYMLLQANDYLWLHDNLGCTIQIGGSDQWGNIIAGVDLIRRKRGEHVHAFSWPLLTAADGQQTRQDHGRPRVARRRQDQPVPVPPALDADRPTTRSGAAADVLAPPGGRDRATRSPSTTRRPQRRLAQRALADEMVTLVHGAEAARRRRPGRRPALLRRSDHRAASGVSRRSPAEIPYSTVDAERTRRHVQAAGRRTGWRSRTATPGATSPRARTT